ncbi:MAG: DHH family phosphoesterase [Anaerolineales bacterium]
MPRHRGDRHILVLQEYPDPDAIASAFAHKLISREFGVEVDLVYSGRLSHQQNVALVKLLGIELLRYEEGFSLRPYQGAVFVDHQGTTAEGLVAALEEAGVPTLVVDHHEPQRRMEPEFADLRRIGATSSIYAEYLEQGLVRLDSADQEPSGGGHRADARADDRHGGLREGGPGRLRGGRLPERVPRRRGPVGNPQPG